MTKRLADPLVEYGIQNEQSDIRAHVCPIARRVYVFNTTNAIERIETEEYRAVPAYQANWNEPTAWGYLVPPFDIAGCVSLKMRNAAWEYLAFSDDNTLGEKGHKAVQLVVGMIRHGLFPLPAIAEQVEDVDMDIAGEDITVYPKRHSAIRIQVKCDYPGGEKELGGTGNLYLQVAESNPFGIH